MSDQKMTSSEAQQCPISNGQECPLGRWLENNRKPERLAFWKKIMFGLLGLLLVLNLVIPNEHPHFGVDSIPGFWPAFSFVVGVAMIFFVKKIVQPLIKRPEDYYGDL